MCQREKEQAEHQYKETLKEYKQLYYDQHRSRTNRPSTVQPHNQVVP